MTSPRIHLHEYSAAEIDAMDAGPLLDALAWQAMGAKWNEQHAEQFTLIGPDQRHVLIYWNTKRPFPPVSTIRGNDEFTFPYRVSRDPGAAMAAFKWLAGKAWDLSLQFSIMMKTDEPYYYVFVSTHPTDSTKKMYGANSRTPELAIARALCKFALRELAAKSNATP